MRKAKLVKKTNSQLEQLDSKIQSQCDSRMQQSATNMVNNLRIINDTPNYTNRTHRTSQVITLNDETRKPVSWVLMVANMIAILASSFQSGYIIYAPESYAEEIGFVFGGILAFDLIVCLYTSYYLSNMWEIINLYLLLDNMLLVNIAASIGFVSFNAFRTTDQWYFTIVNIAFPLDFFMVIGNFRILLVKGEWSKWKIILYKFSLLICCIMFLEIGIYFITVDYSYTKHLDSKFDDQVKELMLLNVFGTFSLIIEMYGKMTDLDHTGQLQSTYELKQFNDNQMANNLIEYTQLLKYRDEAIQKGLIQNEK